MMMQTDRLLKDLLELPAETRVDYLRIRTAAEREALMEAWAKAESLSASDICALPEPYRTELMRFVAGDAERGIPSAGRVFVVEPVDGPINLLVGSRLNKRQYQRISSPTTLPAERAVLALDLWGPNAASELMRGKLREVRPGDTRPRRRKQEAA